MKSRPENDRQNQTQTDDQHSQSSSDIKPFRLAEPLREASLVFFRAEERLEQGRFVLDPSEPGGCRFVEGATPHSTSPAGQDELRLIVDARLKYIQNLLIRSAYQSLAYYQELVDEKKSEIEALEQELKEYEDMVAAYAIKARRARRKQAKDTTREQGGEGRTFERKGCEHHSWE